MILDLDQFKDGFDLVSRAFARLKPYFEEGVTHPRYRQIAGRTLGIRKDESKTLLKEMERRYGLSVTTRNIKLGDD